MSLNRVSISGNLTRSPELKTTAGGTNVLTFGVAVNDRRKNPQTGEWEEVPNFVECAVFGSRAEPLSRFLSKGTKVAIDGKLRYSSWEKEGQKRSKLEVIVEEVEFLSPRNNQQAPAYQQAPTYQQAPQQYAAPAQQYAQTQQYAAPAAQTPQAPTYQQQTFYPNQAPMPAQQPNLYESDDIPF